MTKRTIQLYAAITASGDALATATIPLNCRVKGIRWSICGTAGSADANVLAELSVNSGRQVTTNEASGIISVCSDSFTIVTSGGGNCSVNDYHAVDCPFRQGDKIYLHATETGTASWVTRVILYLE